MPVIEFDVHENLNGYAIVPLTVDDFEQEFVTAFADSERRGLILDTFLGHLNNFRTIVDEEFWVWVGGSFVTRKTNPSDLV